MIELSANFSVKFLLEKLTENLENHRKELEEARAGYFLEVQEEIEKLQKLMGKHPNTFKIPASLKHLAQPVSHVEDYERAIAMLSKCKDVEIELDSDQFAAFVENKWSWRRDWTVRNEAFISKSREVEL